MGNGGEWAGGVIAGLRIRTGKAQKVFRQHLQQAGGATHWRISADALTPLYHRPCQ